MGFEIDPERHELAKLVENVFCDLVTLFDPLLAERVRGLIHLRCCSFMDHQQEWIQASHVFTNNLAFMPDLFVALQEVVKSCPDGSKIISSKSLCDVSRRGREFTFTPRSATSLGAILLQKKLPTALDMFSWTGNVVDMFLGTVDRSLLRDWETAQSRRKRGRSALCSAVSSDFLGQGPVGADGGADSDGGAAASRAVSSVVDSTMDITGDLDPMGVSVGNAEGTGFGIRAHTTAADALSAGTGATVGGCRRAWLKLMGLRCVETFAASGGETVSERVDVLRLLKEVSQDISNDDAGKHFRPGARFRDWRDAQQAVDTLCALFTLPPITPSSSRSSYTWRCSLLTKEPLMQCFGRSDDWVRCPFKVCIKLETNALAGPAGSWFLDKASIFCHTCQ